MESDVRLKAPGNVRGIVAVRSLHHSRKQDTSSCQRAKRIFFGVSNCCLVIGPSINGQQKQVAAKLIVSDRVDVSSEPYDTSWES